MRPLVLAGTLAKWRFVWMGAMPAGRSGWGIPCGGPSAAPATRCSSHEPTPGRDYRLRAAQISASAMMSRITRVFAAL
jgi:hypothetical protein